ncbi:MAG: hypothetical protein AB7O32_08290 [Vicinamibacterales bacterium]
MRTRSWTLLLALAWLAASPARAAADVTAFLGVSPTGGTRSARGLAAGAGLVVVGFEVEGARVVQDEAGGGPALTTGMANILVQTPIEVSRLQFYGTTGAGVYRETLGDRRETSLATNIGGGVKIRVAGPVKLRLDYRLLRLRGAPVHDTYHRVYAGATLGF